MGIPLQTEGPGHRGPKVQLRQRAIYVFHVLFQCRRFKDLRNQELGRIPGRRDIRAVLNKRKTAIKAIKFIKQTQVPGQFRIERQADEASTGRRLKVSSMHSKRRKPYESYNYLHISIEPLSTYSGSQTQEVVKGQKAVAALPWRLLVPSLALTAISAAAGVLGTRLTLPQKRYCSALIPMLLSNNSPALKR